MIKEIKQTEVNDVVKTLREAIELDFNSVIIFGFKEGQIYVESSGAEDNLKLIGALEMAKHHILSSS